VNYVPYAMIASVAVCIMCAAVVPVYGPIIWFLGVLCGVGTLGALEWERQKKMPPADG